MIPTLILPGLNGSPEGHWQRFWVKDRPDAVVVEQDNWTCPVVSHWQQALDKALDEVDSAFIVAHSLGCLLTASYGDRAAARKIKGAFLVAPCSLPVTLALHPCMIDFGEERLARLPFPSQVIGSLNDPYMAVADLRRHVGAWGSSHMTLGFAGHINIASGYGRWEEGYSLFDRFAQEVSAQELRAPCLQRAS